MSTILSRIKDLDLKSVDLRSLSQEELWDIIDKNRAKSVLIGLFMGWSLYRIYKSLTSKKYKLPPGPRAWPLIGNTIDLMTNPRLWELLQQWHSKYGKVLLLYFGTVPTYLISDMELLKEAFIRHGVDYADRPTSFSLELFTKGGKDVAGAQYSPRWVLLRKIFHNALRKYTRGSHITKVISHSMSRVKNLIDSKNGEPFDPTEPIKLLVYNIIGVTCFGKEYELDDPWLNKYIKDVDDLTENMSAGGVVADFIPIFGYIKTPTIKKMIKMRDSMLNYCLDALKEHRESFDPDNISDFTDHMIATQKEAIENPDDRPLLQELDDENYALAILDFFSAGTDSTRVTLHWILLFAVAYPEVQEKMYQEIKTTLGGRDVDASDKDKLSYLDAVLHEALRIRPIAFLGMPHVTRCDTQLGGYDIPKGSQVMTSTYALHMDPEHWEDPTVFKPERWIDEKGDFLYQANGYVPFSLGRRNCPGESLAKVDILMCMTHMFQSYKFTYSGEGEIDLEGTQLMFPKPYKVTAVKRS